MKTCRCIEQGCEVAHLPECPYYREPEPEPDDHGAECVCDECCDRRAAHAPQPEDA